jgi:hypothetical protein
MWIAGDAIFLAAIMLLVAAWMPAETRGLTRVDRQADLDLAQIRIRGDDWPTGSPTSRARPEGEGRRVLCLGGIGAARYSR